MTPTPFQTNRSTYRQAMRHAGRCGPRTFCYRPECRSEFGDYRTVEIVGGRAIYYFCHGVIEPVDSVALKMLAA